MNMPQMSAADQMSQLIDMDFIIDEMNLPQDERGILFAISISIHT